MDYGNLLARAWQITWRNKILWLFGILAGGGISFNGNFGGGGRSNNQGPLPPDIQSQLGRGEVLAVVLVVACIVIVIALALFVLSIIMRGGLIGGIRLADDNGRVTFGEAWAVGMRYFGRMLGIVLLLVLPGLLVAFVFAFAGALTGGLAFICLLPLLCLLIPAFIVLGIIAHFAQFAVVLEDLGVTAAFRRGWEILKANLGNIIVLGLILIVIDFIAGLVLVAPFFAIVIPTLFISAAAGANQPNTGVLAIAALACLCYLPIAIVAAGIVHAWTTSVWTLAYRKFIGSAPALPSAPPMSPPPMPA